MGSSEPTGSKMTDGGVVALESGVTMEAKRGLRQKGHKVIVDSGGFGGFQGIRYDAERDVFIGASESRKDGQAAGY